MTNALLDAIKVNEPFYSNITVTEKKNRIYCHQFQSWIELIEHGLRDFCFYIGQTEPERGWKVEGEYLIRFADGDYSKCPDKPKLYRYWDVHPDLKDHEIREVMRKFGFIKNPYGGSPELVANANIKDLETALLILSNEIQKLNDYYYNFEKMFGISPSTEQKKAKKREEDMFRIPQRFAVYDMCDRLQNLPKDAMIYVPKDAYGRFCDYLVQQGFSNIYTEKDYEYFYGCKELLGSKFDDINLITEEEFFDMKKKFDVIIGNYPYGNGGNLAIDFLAKSSETLKDDGMILQIVPISLRKNGSQNKIIKRNPYLECVSDVDCEKGTFPVGIHAAIQEWRISDTPRQKIEIITSHPDFEFLDYKDVVTGKARVDLVIIRSGNAGRMIRSEFEKYLPKKGEQLDHFFIQAKDQNVVETLVSLEEELVRIGANTNGRNHVSKGEIIEEYQKQAQPGGGIFD